MAGAEFIADFGIIFTALIGVFNLQRNRRSSGAQTIGAFILKHAGENFNLVSLLALGGEAVLPRLAFIKEGLNFLD